MEDVGEVLGVELRRVAVDLDAGHRLAREDAHPERQLAALQENGTLQSRE